MSTNKITAKRQTEIELEAKSTSSFLFDSSYSDDELADARERGKTIWRATPRDFELDIPTGDAETDAFHAALAGEWGDRELVLVGRFWEWAAEGASTAIRQGLLNLGIEV